MEERPMPRAVLTCSSVFQLVPVLADVPNRRHGLKIHVTSERSTHAIGRAKQCHRGGTRAPRAHARICKTNPPRSAPDLLATNGPTMGWATAWAARARTVCAKRTHG